MVGADGLGWVEAEGVATGARCGLFVAGAEMVGEDGQGWCVGCFGGGTGREVGRGG